MAIKASGGRAVVYVIRGPDGVYVGQTLDPERRWRTHCRVGFDVPRWTLTCPRSIALRATPLARSMAKHGPGLFTFSVVATRVATGDESGPIGLLEEDIIEQMLRDGETVLNIVQQVAPRRRIVRWADRA